MFTTESELVEFTLPLMKIFFDNSNTFEILREPKGLFGVPDIVIYNGKIISIEFKLKNWKRAIKQAYRYKTFSYRTYVFMDEKYINSANNNIDFFKKYNIGLCGVGKKNIQLYYEPFEECPYSQELENKIIGLFDL